MKRFCFLIGVVLFAASCSTLPRIQPTHNATLPENCLECRCLFLHGSWQFQHAITATLPGGRKSVLMGVSIVSAENGSFHTILMTIEGWVVFDAEYDREIRIRRAVPPFDSEHFSRGLIHDLRLIFLRPEETLVETGTLANGTAVCRYRQPDEQVVDIVRKTDRHWQLLQYDRRFRKMRTVDIFFNDNFRFDGYHAPDRLKLTAAGFAGYTLDMDLIDAVRLKDKQ